MKKVLFLLQSLRYGGGVENTVSTLSQKLSSKYKFLILTIHDFKNIYPYDGKYYSLRENQGFIQKSFSLFKIHLFIRYFRIYMSIKSFSPDIVISFMELVNIYAIITKFLFRLKVPLIISVVCNPKMQFKDNMSYMNYLIKILYPIKIVNRIVSISKRVKDKLIDFYGIEAHKLKVINNAIDIKKINNMKKDKISGHRDIFYNENLIKFIIVGRLRVEKGHDYLIKAFSKVKVHLPNSKLIIIGDGPLRKELEQLIEKLALKNEVLLMGLRKNPYKYMAKSDIFVLSSKNEGFPIVLLEALACGLPIISTDCETGPREILDNGRYGLLAKVMDINDLAEKMINLANNTPLLEDLSKLSIKRAENFDIKKSLKEWIILIENEIKLSGNLNHS